jgi:Phage integrase family
VTQRFGELVDKVGLRPIRLHDLRHGQASLMLAGGADMKTISARLGHSSQHFTADSYTHLLEGVQRKAANAAAALVPRAVREQPVIEVTTRAQKRARQTTAPLPRAQAVHSEDVEPSSENDR